MTTVWVVGRGACAAAPRLRWPSPSAATTAATAQPLLERRLNVLRMLEVRDERRAHLHQQTLQLGVARARDQRLVDGVQDRLVVGDLVIDVGFVELGPLE